MMRTAECETFPLSPERLEARLGEAGFAAIRKKMGPGPFYRVVAEAGKFRENLCHRRGSRCKHRRGGRRPWLERRTSGMTFRGKMPGP